MMVVGSLNPPMAFVVRDTILTRLRRITCLKYTTMFSENLHFSSLNVTPALPRKVSTVQTRSFCFCV